MLPRWFFLLLCLLANGCCEEVEVVEAVSGGSDQIAQESVSKEASRPLLLKPYHGALPPPPQPYHGPPPPLPPPDAIEKLDAWPVSAPDMPKIVSLDVKCEKNSMKVFVGFDKPFYGVVFSKGHYSNADCVHLPAGLGRTAANFEIGIHACGTAGNTENGLYGYGADSGSGTYFENIIVVQYDPQVQEVWDQARKLRCTWHDQYEKSVTFRPFPVDMLDVVRADFAGDNVGCWMQIQVGKGPWASEVSGLVKIGQTMTMVLAIKDDDSKFDMLVRNCMAHDGKRAPIQLVDRQGCVTRPKLMSRFTKIKNFGASASVLSYAHFQAFKFPDSMEVHFQCTIQICRYQCPDQCSSGHVEADSYGPPPPPQRVVLDGYRPRDERRVRRHRRDASEEVGVNRIIRVVSTGDLTFSLDDSNTTAPTMVFPADAPSHAGVICMTTPGFAATLALLLAVLVISCLLSAFLCIRLRLRLRPAPKALAYPAPVPAPVPTVKVAKSCFYS
ncbi:uncharacterized protein LOC111060077 [Nilaparvata lugens]|uniref:uncharacterized protein LOC111060077 n=1 Tax=Nilaparvata lugens TaxID=108931 RepID=UPI00193DF8F5|nr:uncharacterized protein LOC111060077 [Nilaparvata lugens]XP_039287161.1 uncharacterized protein LOC111060077 [Nilaparvata lugens]XP_039287167.1 uncharacterized protein LOC111060077 [Nilaparvata lugens]XP_039287174.1 uncharacterized protein LOC111060077 [Nilaparvata lugens]